MEFTSAAVKTFMVAIVRDKVDIDFAGDFSTGDKGDPAARILLDRYKGDRGLRGPPGEPGLAGLQGSPGKP